MACECQNLCLLPFCHSPSVGQALPQFPSAMMHVSGDCLASAGGAQCGAVCSRQAGDAWGAWPPCHRPPPLSSSRCATATST